MTRPDVRPAIDHVIATDQQTAAVFRAAATQLALGRQSDKAMINLMSEMLKLEAAVVDNKNDEAAAILKNLAKVKSDGHDKFQEE